MQPLSLTLRALREYSKMSQIEVAQWLSANYKPTNAKVISSWERGGSIPNAEQLIHLCDVYGVDNIRLTFLGKKTGLNDIGIRRLQEYAELLAESGRYAYIPAPEPLRKLRLYDLPVSAGAGAYLDSDDYEEIEVDVTVPRGTDYAVRISGDSMTPRFVDGQIIFIHQQPNVEDGEIGIFYLNGNAYCKKKLGGFLVSLNPKYEPIRLREHDEFRVYGKVVG